MQTKRKKTWSPECLINIFKTWMETPRTAANFCTKCSRNTGEFVMKETKVNALCACVCWLCMCKSVSVYNLFQLTLAGCGLSLILPLVEANVDDMLL